MQTAESKYANGRDYTKSRNYTKDRNYACNHFRIRLPYSRPLSNKSLVATPYLGRQNDTTVYGPVYPLLSNSKLIIPEGRKRIAL